MTTCEREGRGPLALRLAAIIGAVALTSGASVAWAEDLIPWEGAPDSEAEESVSAEAPSSGDAVETAKERSAPGIQPATLGGDVSDRSNYRAISGVGGAAGLPGISTPVLGPAGTLRLSLMGELFSGVGLLEAGDEASRQAITFAAGLTPTEWLELYGSVAFRSTSNTRGDPELMLVHGDVAFGLKGGYEVIPGLFAGADLGFALNPYFEEPGLSMLGLWPRLLAAADLRDLAGGVPLVAHVDAGIILDKTDDAGAPGDDWSLSLADQFALGVHGYDRMSLGVGIEAPLPLVTPFAAWRLRAPLGQISVPDDAVAYGQLVSNVVSLGAKVTAMRDLTLMAAVDLGLSGTTVEGLPPTMPWNLFFGASYVIDPLGRYYGEAPVIERAPAVPAQQQAPQGARLTGVIKDAETGEPIASAVITIPSAGGYPVATNAKGEFRTHDVPAGVFEVMVERRGYETVKETAQVARGDTASLEVAMSRLPAEEEDVEDSVPAIQPGKLMLSVLDGAAAEAMEAGIKLRGAGDIELATDEAGHVQTTLVPGEYVLTIMADGFLWRQLNLEIAEGEEVDVEIALTPEPEEELVLLADRGLELKMQVEFEDGSATMLPESHVVLDQIIDVIARNDIDRIVVEGHTDNRGDRDDNVRLSEERAEEIRRYLIIQGLYGHRIDTRGLGPDRPIAPNHTQRGRAMNQRIEIHLPQGDA